MATSLSGRRREIAALLTERDMTLYELAKAMGKPSGSIYRLVHRMVADEILMADPYPPTRGTLFSLNPLHGELLREGLGGETGTGTLFPNQRLVLVEGIGVASLYDVFARMSSAASIAWVAEVGGIALLALFPDTSKVQADRLAIALERAGGTVRSGYVGEVLAGDAVRRAGATMDDLTRAR